MDTMGLARLLEALNEPCDCEFIGPRRVRRVNSEGKRYWAKIEADHVCDEPLVRWWQS